MDNSKLLSNAIVMAVLLPPLQTSDGLLGIPWWVWLVVIIILLILLLIGLVMKQEPGPPIEHQNARPYPVAKPAAPAEIAEPAASAAEEAPAIEPVTTAADDLKRVEGIGPKTEELLQAAGIRTFAQLAAADPDRLREILAEADLRMIDPASWPEQAQLAADGKWDEFEKLTENLKGGRRA